MLFASMYLDLVAAKNRKLGLTTCLPLKDEDGLILLCALPQGITRSLPIFFQAILVNQILGLLNVLMIGVMLLHFVLQSTNFENF